MTGASAWRAEEAAINGFPPLRQVVVDGWMLRFSGSVRRTANSATPLYEPRGDLAALVATAESLYRRHNQPTIFRLPSFVDPAIDAALAGRGYTTEGESCIIEGPLVPIVAAGRAFGSADAVVLTPKPPREWLAAMARLQGQSPEYHAVYRRVVGAVALPAAFAMLAVDGEAVALAYAVIHRGLLCYESVVTSAAYRRRGFSRRVLAALAAWGGENGAGAAGLQVEASNGPARALYHSLGMVTELHRYHYRRAPRAGRGALDFNGSS
ncbi:MAG TPA: GNAT family N-acetyltransferase [Stellaceae bacterium]|nr:GNAT family N-acetyltransferase [Stellaceae bacterium]